MPGPRLIKSLKFNCKRTPGFGQKPKADPGRAPPAHEKPLLKTRVHPLAFVPMAHECGDVSATDALDLG